MTIIDRNRSESIIIDKLYFILTHGRTRIGGDTHRPLRFFWVSSQRIIIKRQHLMFSEALCSSLGAFWVKSSDGHRGWMVSFYGYEIWRHRQEGVNPFLGWKYMFFQLFSTIKVNHVAKIMQSTYLCVIFHLKHKNSPYRAVSTWFLILGKIQEEGQDGDHCWQRHRPTSSVTTHKIYLIL